MISIFIWLLLVGTLESGTIRNQRAAACSWKGHCAGDQCITYDDCDGSLTCQNGKCSDGSSSGGGGGGSSGGTCSPSGVLRGTSTKCNTDNMSTCCAKGVNYNQYQCSPSSKSSALLTLNSFQEGGDGGGAGACFEKFYPDSQPVVALSTGWYNGGSRCGKMITISANGKSTKAMVVDQCDSVNGCDAEHAGQPPCRNNIVDGSPAVWAALVLSKVIHDTERPVLPGVTNQNINTGQTVYFCFH